MAELVDAPVSKTGEGKPHAGSIPALGTALTLFIPFLLRFFIPAPVAQWIARLPPKEQVAGSIPARGVYSVTID